MAVWGAALVVFCGAALVVIGLWALSLKPRRVTTLAFAAYEVGTGFFFVVLPFSRAFPSLPAVVVPLWLKWAASAILWIALAALAIGLPRPLRRDEMRLLVRPVLLSGVFWAGVVAWPTWDWVEVGPFFIVTNAGNWGVTFFAIALTAERFLHAQGPDADAVRHHLSLIAAALTLIVAEATGRILAGAAASEGNGLPLVWGSVIVVVLLGGMWIALSARVPGAGSRLARNLAFATFGAALFGALWATAFGASLGQPRGAGGSLGVAALAGSILLARGALVHNLLGAGVQLRWGISKSTIAAVFIAVFFVASELAQQFFSDRTSSTYIGIGIAGTLVFAMAPLQRMAEKLAAKAVPVQPTAVMESRIATAGSEREESFRRAVRVALRDRRMTRDEERDLLELAHHLGISPLRAGRIQDEIADEPKPRLTRRGHA